MKTTTLKALILSVSLVGAASFFGACSQEVSHSESDKHGLFGGTKHVEDSTYQHPDGTISHEHQEIKVNP